MIHGLLVGNLASWYFGTAPVLANHYCVLLYDLRGHGRSQRPTHGYELQEMTRDLAGLVVNEDAPLTLVGHSYGALVALHYAIQFPQRVARLVLVEAPLPPSDFTGLTEFIELEPEQMIHSMPAELQALVAHGGRRGRRLVSGLTELATNTTILSDLRSEADLADEQLATVTCPVLAVYGKRSACRPVADRLQAVLPDCQRVLLDGGHFLPLERTAELTHSIERFLNG
jgi:pimeloyl-ACP methyl ester carboxylesterase